MLHSFAESHIGQRKVNEDNYLIDQESNLYIVADGVGGMSKGEIASHLACEVTLKSIKSGMDLKQSVKIAHQKIVEEINDDDDKKGMATTIVAVLFKDNSYEVAWVGDSRAYIWDKELKLITRDDSYVELLLENGHIGIDELETHPDRNVISQALGIVRKDILINYNSGTLENDQILMLCTDGLYSIANELNIITSIKNNKNVQELTRSLVEKAVEKEGKDNITLLSILSDESSANSENIIMPKVFREFDIVTGKPVGNEIQKNVETMTNNNKLELDPELVDQTHLKDLTQDQLNLLDAAAANQFVSPKKSTGYLIPIILVVILCLLGLLMYLNQ